MEKNGMSVKALGKREFVVKCFPQILGIEFNAFSRKYSIHLASWLDFFPLPLSIGLCTSSLRALGVLCCTCSLAVTSPTLLEQSHSSHFISKST